MGMAGVQAMDNASVILAFQEKIAWSAQAGIRRRTAGLDVHPNPAAVGTEGA
jgi:hypothetical protein